MNLILLKGDELNRPLPRGDERHIHILKILKAVPGDELQGGLVNGPLGTIRVERFHERGMDFSFQPLMTPPLPLRPITLLLGCPRPPTARRLLKDLTTLGAERLIFADTDLNEKSYLRAKLWRDGLFERALLDGAMQGRTTTLPRVDRVYSLQEGLDSLGGGSFRLMPDLEESENLLGVLTQREKSQRTVIAVGPERGWTDGERRRLREAGFRPVSLGDRTLRTETAALIAAGAAVLSLEEGE